MRVAHAPGMRGTVPRHRLEKKPPVSDPGIHHSTCVTHVPWCMSGSLTRGDGERVPGIPWACATRNLRIWQEAHGGANAPGIPGACATRIIFFLSGKRSMGKKVDELDLPPKSLSAAKTLPEAMPTYWNTIQRNQNIKLSLKCIENVACSMSAVWSNPRMFPITGLYFALSELSVFRLELQCRL